MSAIRRTRREDYLAAIESICEETGSPRAATGPIAQRVGVSKGTASSVLRELADDELVDLIPYEGVRLTEAGRRLARRIVRRYRLLELFLRQTLAAGGDSVADDAWHLEPGASDKLIEQIDFFLKQPEYDARGDPIPRRDGSSPPSTAVPILACSVDSTVRVSRVRHQPPEIADLLQRVGIVVGAELRIQAVSAESGVLLLESESGTHSIPYCTARQILVEPVSR